VFGSVDFSNFGRESILKNDALCDARDGILNTPRIARPAWFSFRAWREVCAETQACGNRHVELKPMASACDPCGHQRRSSAAAGEERSDEPHVGWNDWLGRTHARVASRVPGREIGKVLSNAPEADAEA
jgi:hypothetical protein